MKNIHWPAMIIALVLATLIVFPVFFLDRMVGV
jgi:hypothetical protein